MMKSAAAALLVTAIAVGTNMSVRAAELNIVYPHGHSYKSSHLHMFWRAGPQDCFLMPDVIVAVDALGPYCSSPRARYRQIVRRW
jgi:hypothetical protein